MSRNNIRGPTSALTEFLRESGITPTTIAIARRNATANAANAGPSSSARQSAGDDENGGDEEQSSPRRVTSGYRSDDLDESDNEMPLAKKLRLTKAAQEKLKKGKEKAKAKKNGKKGDDGEDDEEQDVYTALSKSTWGGAAPAKPPVGNFETCVKCEKEFTVTKYTMAANPGPGFLCHKCAKESGIDPFKKAAPLRKRRVPADKRVVVKFEENRFPTLASLCIEIVTKHITDVEALGDIGNINMDQIAKAISKNRSLTTENAHIFYDVQNTTLTLYDVTNLTPPALCTLASLNPNLTSLRLEKCGRMDSTVIDSWCHSLPSLTRLELVGPFLVRSPAWQSFFESHSSLTGFLITHSPRFDLECIHALRQHCSGLTELRLREMGKLDDEFIDVMKELTGLTYLDLGYPTTSLSEEALVDLMRGIGGRLMHLDLSGHESLSDRFLIDGIKAHSRTLTELALSNVPLLTDEGVAEFFDTWAIKNETDRSLSNPPLTILDLSRNTNLSSAALTAILSHSGKTLTHLNINGWKSTSEKSLVGIATRTKELRWLDVGWCREMDNFVMKSIMEKCDKVKEVKVWGCNRLTEHCPRNRNVSIYGAEAHALVA